jgi:hypothetical protein
MAGLGFPGAINTRTVGINNLGEIVGNYDTTGGTYGYTLSSGVYTAFTAVSGATLDGINDSGDLVGETGSGAFLFSGGVVYPISFPGSTSTNVAGVANRVSSTVEVVGNYTDISSKSHGFYAVVTLP